MHLRLHVLLLDLCQELACELRLLSLLALHCFHEHFAALRTPRLHDCDVVALGRICTDDSGVGLFCLEVFLVVEVPGLRVRW